ncbi:MAG: GntR family transcriptional regulator [Cellulosilyticaceae bacterium]
MNIQTFSTNKMQSYKNMPDLIAEALKEAILHGQFRGGVQLKQDEIAKQFDVSLIPVREALIQLEAGKLVTCIRNKGALVTTLSLKEMKMIFELRKILEIGSIARIATNEIDAQIDKMKYLINKMENEEDIFSFSRYDRLFHELICDSACNAQLSDTYRNIFVTVERYLMYIYHLVESRKSDIEEHREIVRLLEIGDRESLTDKLTEHIEGIEVRFIAYIEANYTQEPLDWNEFLPFYK